MYDYVQVAKATLENKVINLKCILWRSDSDFTDLALSSHKKVEQIWVVANAQLFNTGLPATETSDNTPYVKHSYKMEMEFFI